jgi:hypothetical protein
MIADITSAKQANNVELPLAVVTMDVDVVVVVVGETVGAIVTAIVVVVVTTTGADTPVTVTTASAVFVAASSVILVFRSAAKVPALISLTTVLLWASFATVISTLMLPVERNRREPETHESVMCCGFTPKTCATTSVSAAFKLAKFVQVTPATSSVVSTMRSVEGPDTGENDGYLVGVSEHCDMHVSCIASLRLRDVVGFFEGLVLGDVLGLVEGLVLGEVLGEVDGDVLGEVEGDVLGDVDGTSVGCVVVGESVGVETLGPLEGL